MAKGIYIRKSYKLTDPDRCSKHSMDMKGNKHLVGHKHSEETKLKMSLARKGKKKSLEWRMKIGLANTGRKQSEECKRKIGLKQRGKPQPKWFSKFISEVNKGKLSGNKNPMWRGGISKEPYPFEFNRNLKEQIRSRDNYKCQLCGTPQSECIHKLNVHHIDYNKTNLSISNLISLCNRCHMHSTTKREEYKYKCEQIIKRVYAK